MGINVIRLARARSLHTWRRKWSRRRRQGKSHSTGNIKHVVRRQVLILIVRSFCKVETLVFCRECRSQSFFLQDVNPCCVKEKRKERQREVERDRQTDREQQKRRKGVR